LLDYLVTLWGQPVGYWLGDYEQVRELAPHGMWILRQHPAWFVLLGAAANGVAVVAILRLPRPLALGLALALVMGHAWGIGTWLPMLCYPHGYWACLLLFVASSGAVVAALELGRWHATEPVRGMVAAGSEGEARWVGPAPTPF
jgi:hypothetical protein